MHIRHRLLLTFLILVFSTSLFAQTQTQIPGTLQAENYDPGGFYDKSVGNAFGVCRFDDVDVGAIPGGGCHIGFVENDEWVLYTVNVAATGWYDVTLRWASDYSGLTSFRLLQDGVPLTTQPVTKTSVTAGDWHRYETRSFLVRLDAGVHILRVEFVQGAWNFDSLVFTPRVSWNGAIPIPGTLQAEEYDRGGNNVAWFDTTAGNVFGALRQDDMDVGAIPGGGFHIGFLTDGEWAEYTVNINTPGPYNVTVRKASAYGGATRFRLLLDGAPLTTRTVSSTGDWQTYDTDTFPVTLNTTTGTHILRVEFTQGSWNFDSLAFAPQTTCTPPSVTMPANAAPNAGSASYTLRPTSVSPGTYQWLRNGLPIGQPTTVAELVFTNLEEWKDAGNYALRVTNACGGTTTSTATRLRVNCAGPGQDTRNIYRVLSNQGLYCDFVDPMVPDFPDHGVGSFNIPVVAAAVAFIHEPVRNDPAGKSWDAVNWWDLYLQGELGLRGQGVWQYGGGEFGSNTYNYFNIISVMAVYRWASLQPQTTVMQRIVQNARSWLRATFTLHALAATPSYPLTKHADIDGTPGFNSQARDFCQNAPANCAAYNGPYIAMAGERTLSGHWNDTHRSILFNRAVELIPGASQSGEDAQNIRPTRQRIEAMWTDARDAYGLTEAERQELRAIANDCQRPTNDLVGHYLGSTLRTRVPYRFVNWQNPRVRATMMERNTNTWPTVPTMGVAYFDFSREAHFLYPWIRAFDGETPNQGAVAAGVLDLANRRMIATSPDSPASPGGWNVEVRNLPSALPCFEVTLRPDAAPSVTSRVTAPSTGLGNLAQGKLTTMSSVYFGTPTAGPHLAADGNTDGNFFNGSVTHSALDAQAWWQVDLGSVSAIDQIKVWNRTDCCGDRLSNFYVLVSDAPFSSTSLSTTINQLGVSNYYVAGQAGTPSYVPVGRSGRYVRVQLAGTNYLSIAEVQVFGQAGTPPPATVWIEDSIPAGAVTVGDNGDAWTWIDSSVKPGPWSGSLAHQSNVYGVMHQHYFDWATATLSLQTGDVLFAYVFLDPVNPPSQVMLQWNDGTWEHRAYWGANQIEWGADGTTSRRSMGALPPTGQWVKLQVPASSVGLEGRTLKGMAFTLFGGRATWDQAGKY